MPEFGAALVAVLLAGTAAAPERVSFPTEDGGIVYADLYGKSPKELVILEGSAHAQLIFETDQAERLMREILRFLSEP